MAPDGGLLPPRRPAGSGDFRDPWGYHPRGDGIDGSQRSPADGSTRHGVVLLYIAYSLSQQVISVVERAQSGEIASRQLYRVLALLPGDAPIHRTLVRPLLSRPAADQVPGACEVRLEEIVVDTHEDRRTPSALSAVLPAGSTTWIEGPSGIGKSTLLQTIAGLRSPRSGRVLINNPGKNAEQRSTPVLVESDLPALPIAIDALIDLENQGGAGEHLRQVFAAAGRECPDSAVPLDQLDHADRQLVALARSLFRRPQVLLLDEATSALSIQAERCVLHLVQQAGCTLLVVSHRPDNRDLAGSSIRLHEGKTADAAIKSQPDRGGTDAEPAVVAAKDKGRSSDPTGVRR